MAIFNSYVSLPEGIQSHEIRRELRPFRSLFEWMEKFRGDPGRGLCAMVPAGEVSCPAGALVGALAEILGETVGKPWKNHGKTMEKAWDNHRTSRKSRNEMEAYGGL